MRFFLTLLFVFALSIPAEAQQRAKVPLPGGNITGSTNILPELAGKRLELLRELLPKLSRMAFLAYGPDPAHRLFVKDAQDAAQSFKIRFQPLVLVLLCQ
jgi:ABC-type uncharacterized transport system substrate-binding protein